MDQNRMPTAETERREKFPKDRKTRRQFLPRHRVGMQAPGSARVRSSIRTGTTKHFTFWMSDLQMRSALQKTRTAALAEHVEDPLVSSAMGLFVVGGIRNVWQLIRADKADLLRITGIGPSRLKAVHAYLIEHNVKPSWTID